MHGIKRIDFDKVHRTDLDEQYADDEMICPYCKETIGFEGEEINGILGGESYQCPYCSKWFYVRGEATIETTTTPIEDEILDHREHIERMYRHSDDCEAGGVDFPHTPYGIVEYEIYADYARPFFENLETEEK